MLAEYGARAALYAAAALAALNAVFGWMFLTETVTDRVHRPFSWARANHWGTLRILGKLPAIGPLLLVYFLCQMAFTVYPVIWSYFWQERFGRSPAKIGVSVALFGIMLAIVQGGLMPTVLRILGERGTGIYGHGVDILAFLAMAFVTSGIVASILTPLAALADMITPALQGVISKAMDDDQQGELQGAVTSVSAHTMIISPMGMMSVFATFPGESAPIYLPGAPFLLTTRLILGDLILFIRSGRAETSSDIRDKPTA